jgi:MFS family permease
VIAVAMGLSCFAMSWARGPLLVFLAFSSLRALGQGSLTINATLMTAQWFVRKRGRAMALMGLGFPVSVAVLPQVARFLIDHAGWREAYMVLGVMVWVLVLPIAAFVMRERPEAMGLYPDGDDRPPEGEAEFTQDMLTQPDTRPVLSSPLFWALVLPLSVTGLVGTGMIFHQVSIFEERGLSATAAAAVFVPYAIVSAASSIFAGYFIDRVGPKPVYVVAMLLLLGAMGMSFFINSLALGAAYAASLGMASGASQVVGSVAWAHYYGRFGLGRVQGSAMMVNIAASALGPLPLAWLQSQLGRFDLSIAVLAVLPVAGILAVTLVRRTPGGTPAASAIV